MKKSTNLATIAILVILVLAITLCACNMRSADEFDLINSLMKQDYSTITLVVETTLFGETLLSTFEFSYGQTTTVVYHCNEFATFEQTEDGQYIIPDEYVISMDGTASIVDGQLVAQNGDSIDLPAGVDGGVAFEFKSSYFEAGQHEIGRYTANVTAPQAFMKNNSLVCSNMTVDVDYSTQMEKLVITYISNGANVKLTYLFD